MEVHLKIIGSLFVILSLLHIGFPKYFGWKEQLKSLSIINRQMMQVHTFFVAFAVFLIGILCLRYSSELITTPFGNDIALGLGIFWTIRLLIQFFGYSYKLWKGKPFETTIHILFSLLWIYVSIIFFWVYYDIHCK